MAAASGLSGVPGRPIVAHDVQTRSAVENVNQLVANKVAFPMLEGRLVLGRSAGHGHRDRCARQEASHSSPTCRPRSEHGAMRPGERCRSFRRSGRKIVARPFRPCPRSSLRQKQFVLGTCRPWPRAHLCGLDARSPAGVVQAIHVGQQGADGGQASAADRATAGRDAGPRRSGPRCHPPRRADRQTLRRARSDGLR
jgi:hypothetical protein